MGYACQFTRRKGLMTFIDCAELLAPEHEDLSFVIAGGDLYEGSPFVQEVRSEEHTSELQSH